MRLRDKGNTVLVVEHDPDVMAVADHIVDMGPRAGSEGGHVVFEGPFDRLRASDTLTGRSLRRRTPLKSEFRSPLAGSRSGVPICTTSRGWTCRSRPGC